MALAAICAAARAEAHGGGPGHDPGRCEDHRARAERLEAALDAALERELAEHPEVRCALALVHLPARDLLAAKAAGVADALGRRPATPSTAFRLASVTKMMTAVVVMQLVSEGRLGLGDTLERLEGVIPLDALHVLDGVAYGRRITVEQLLRHRSGLSDYALDGPRDADALTPYMLDVLANPSAVRSPASLVQWTIDHLPPVAAPGAAYHYADTNYVLLGLLAEDVEARPLARIYRDRVFVPLGMTSSYLEFYEAAPHRARRPAQTFLGALDVTSFSLGEWGGGGVVSTLRDLDRFMRGLFEARLVSPAVLQAMLAADEIGPGVGYGLGVVRWEPWPGVILYGHDGFFGENAWFLPQLGATIAFTVNQVSTDASDLLVALVVAAAEAGR